MSDAEQRDDKDQKSDYGSVNFRVGYQGYPWLTNRCDLDSLADLILQIICYGLAQWEANPEVFHKLSQIPVNRRKERRKIEREINKDAVEAIVQQMTSEERTVEAPQEFIHTINALLTYIVNNLPDAINYSLYSLMIEGLLAQRLEDSDPQSPTERTPDQTIVTLLNEYKVSIKRRLGLTRRQRKARYDLSEVLIHYTTVLPLWQDAKEIYKDNRTRSWQQIVKTVHPYLPDDLVARLSANPSDLSDETKEYLAEKGGTSEPSDIAIEHAARLCGAPDYCYALSTLEGKKTELSRATKSL